MLRSIRSRSPRFPNRLWSRARLGDAEAEAVARTASDRAARVWSRNGRAWIPVRQAGVLRLLTRGPEDLKFARAVGSGGAGPTASDGTCKW